MQAGAQVSVCALSHLQFELKLWHHRDKEQRVDCKELLNEVKYMLRQITHGGLSHHQHLIKELQIKRRKGLSQYNICHNILSS